MQLVAVETPAGGVASRRVRKPVEFLEIATCFVFSKSQTFEILEDELRQRLSQPVCRLPGLYENLFVELEGKCHVASLPS
jgi:hypothetical protein